MVEGDIHRGIIANGSQLAREERLLAIALELGLRSWWSHLVDVGVDVIQTIPFRQQGLGALLTDALDPRDIVRRVTPDPEGVGNELRRTAELLLDFGKRDSAVFHGVEEGDVIGDELHQILVRGDEDHVERVFVTAREGAHDIVGLEVVDAEEGHVEGFSHPGEVRHLGAKRVRHIGSGALVLREITLAE